MSQGSLGIFMPPWGSLGFSGPLRVSQDSLGLLFTSCEPYPKRFYRCSGSKAFQPSFEKFKIRQSFRLVVYFELVFETKKHGKYLVEISISFCSNDFKIMITISCDTEHTQLGLASAPQHQIQRVSHTTYQHDEKLNFDPLTYKKDREM